jgi:hypothetical protein
MWEIAFGRIWAYVNGYPLTGACAGWSGDRQLGLFGWLLGEGWRCEMAGSVDLKKAGVVARVGQYPLGAFLGGMLSAAVSGVLGLAHGGIVAGVMAVLGAAVGAVLGAMLEASAHGDS